MKRRLRNEIIDLNTGQRYSNESEAAEQIGISRYLIHKSLRYRKICKGCAFAYYSYGMDIDFMRSLYIDDIRKKRTVIKEVK
jgi:hypothetical protein